MCDNCGEICIGLKKCEDKCIDCSSCDNLFEGILVKVTQEKPEKGLKKLISRLCMTSEKNEIFVILRK